VDGPGLLGRIRGLLAMAESSRYPAEAAAFAAKARQLAGRFDVDPALLRYPREPLAVAVLVAELARLQDELRRFTEGEEKARDTQAWSACLDDYDLVLEAAAELLQVPVARLPFGARRHFRPEERAEIEVLLQVRLGRRPANTR
jgi:hypothetical protein